VKEQIKKIIKKNYPYFKLFIIIGLICTGIDYVFYKFFLNFIEINKAKFASTIFAVIINYCLNSKFNFEQLICFNFKTAVRYILLYLLLIQIHVAINEKFYYLYNNIEVAFIFAMSCSVFINYFSVLLFCHLVRKKK
jgi:putative flippase GtrA